MGRPNLGDRRQVTTRIKADLYGELERYADYLNLSVNDAVALAIGNMVSQARYIGADYPLARPWMDAAMAKWIEAQDE